MKSLVVFASLSIGLLPYVFSQSLVCAGIQPQQTIKEIATAYATEDEEFMMDLTGEIRAFQMLDIYNPDASYFSSSLKNTEPEKVEYSWLNDVGHLYIKQKSNGLFSTPIDRTFSYGKIWQIFINTKPVVENENSFNGLYLRARVSGEDFDRYIILMGNKKTSAFWFGEYNTSTKIYTSFHDVENSDCNFVTHPSVEKYGSVDYSIYRNGNYLFLRINSSFLFNYEITDQLIAFDNIVEAGIITLNAQETEVSHVQWNNFSSMTGISLEQYEQKENSDFEPEVDSYEEPSAPAMNFYGTFLMYYGRNDIVSVTHAYEVYANQYPSESELLSLKNEKYYKDALEYELLIGSDFVPDLTCDEAFEMLDEVYSESGLENFSSDYCLEDYELDN